MYDFLLSVPTIYYQELKLGPTKSINVMYLSPPQRGIIHVEADTLEPRIGSILQLPWASRQLWNEAVRLLWSLNTFEVHILDLGDFVAHLMDWERKAIETVQLVVPDHVDYDFGLVSVVQYLLPMGRLTGSRRSCW